MIYLKIAYAAVMRYRIEKPFRDIYYAKWPNRKQTYPLGSVLKTLARAGLIDYKALKPQRDRYKRLSKLLHGTPGA